MGFFDRLLGRPASSTTTTPRTTRTRTKSTPETDAPDLDDAERESATARIAEIQQSLAAGEGESWELHQEAGILHERLGELDSAITAHETALAEHTRYGESYNRLMTHYNTKLSQSSAAGDGDAINRWMSKIDELLATSKRIMRENY